MANIFHVAIGFYIFSQIPELPAEPFEERILVERVPPPPVKLKIHPREIPREISRVARAQHKA